MSGSQLEEKTPGGACKEYEWLVGPYVDGEIPKGEARDLESHFNSCQSCRALADQFRNLDGLARSALGQLPVVSAQEWGHVWENINNERTGVVFQKERRRIFDWLLPALAVAALLFLGVWLGFTLLGGKPPDGEPPPAPFVRILELEGSDEPTIDVQDDIPLIDFSG